MTPSHRIPALALLLAATAACAGSGTRPDPADPTELPSPDPAGGPRIEIDEEDGRVAMVETNRDPLEQPIGFFLTELDRRMKLWNQLRIGAESPRDISKRDIIEEEITYWARSRSEELEVELTYGPLRNRCIAATALGFTDDAESLPPLLAALGDRSGQVVGNALIGIGLLARPETPMGEIASILRHHEDAWTRNNAAFALKHLVRADAEANEEVIASCRQGLDDPEAGVRLQCAEVLAHLVDDDSVPLVSKLLYDDLAGVRSAAAQSLYVMGSREPELKGACGRQLVDALVRLDKDERGPLFYNLARLSDVNHGEDIDDWTEWAYGLP